MTTHKDYLSGYKSGVHKCARIIQEKIKKAQKWPNQTKGVKDYIKGLQSALEAINEVKG